MKHSKLPGNNCWLSSLLNSIPRTLSPSLHLSFSSFAFLFPSFHPHIHPSLHPSIPPSNHPSIHQRHNSLCELPGANTNFPNLWWLITTSTQCAWLGASSMVSSFPTAKPTLLWIILGYCHLVFLSSPIVNNDPSILFIEWQCVSPELPSFVSDDCQAGRRQMGRNHASFAL